MDTDFHEVEAQKFVSIRVIRDLISQGLSSFTMMSLKPHSPAWYDNLAHIQQSYYYPWQTTLPLFHGEDVYQEMVRQHLSPTSDVLEVACAQGEFARSLAPHCQSITAYDRILPWIQSAQQEANSQGLTNITFLCHDSSLEANNGQACLPAPDDAFDLLICSKGPFHWIDDARRVARPGAVLLMLVPDAVPLTPWHERLPERLRWQQPIDPHWARGAIKQRLTEVGLEMDSWWSFDVPEIFPDPEQLYIWLSWGMSPDEVPSLVEIAPLLGQIFDEYSTAQGLEIRYHRYIWKAIVAADI